MGGYPCLMGFMRGVRGVVFLELSFLIKKNRSGLKPDMNPGMSYIILYSSIIFDMKA